MTKLIRLASPKMPTRAKGLLDEVWESGQFSPGRKVKEFEQAFAVLHSAQHGLFVNSGTDALRVALLALKEKYRWADGDEVAVPALTFPATINVVLQAGLVPRLVDVAMRDYTMNAENLERQWDTSPSKLADLKCVIPVHLFGQTCSSYVYDLAARQDWKILEDSCETILNPLRGDISCYSTYMAHHLVTGVGGLAVTNDEDLDGLMWSYANHGRREMGKFDFDRIGYSARATEWAAALGLAQLDELDAQVAHRISVSVRLRKALEPFDDFVLPADLGRWHTWLMFPIVIKERASIDRDWFCRQLDEAGIENRPMMPITNQPCYKHLAKAYSYSVAEWVNAKGFYIPCHPGMDDEDVGYVADVFKKVLDTIATVI